MSDKKRETVSDIVAQLRAAAHIQNADSPRDVLKFADRIEAAAKREREAGAELRKCLKDAIGEKCSMCAYIDNEMSAFYGKPVCGNKGCKYKRWRKALETMEGYAE